MFTQTISCPEAKNLLNRGAQLVDVRSPMEYQQYAIPGSKNIPLQQITAAVNEIDPNKPVVVYCQSGGRSEQAKQVLQMMGFNEVHNLGSIQKFYNC